MDEKNIVVLYHNNCSDGFGGAWVAKRKFGDKADYIGVFHHNPPPEDLINKNVYIIDFAYDSEETKKILEEAKSLTILDHHITAKKVVESVPNHVYDTNHSGAVIAWKYFFPDEKIPIFLKYIEDGDLWRFKLRDSREFFSLLLTMPLDFKKWDELVEDFEDEKKRKVHINHGKMLFEYQQKVIRDLLQEAEEVTLDGQSALAVNSSTLRSQLGNSLVKEGYDIGIIWYHTGRGIIKVSLRSDKEGGVDVGKIAEKYGGGGHKSSAAFIINPGGEFPWKHKGIADSGQTLNH